jgi:hypothetical protein
MIMKFEMEFGWIGNEKITVETYDFDKIQIIQEFIEFQEEHGWAVNYEAIDCDDDDFEEDTEEEIAVADSKTKAEVVSFALNDHEPL